MPSQQAALASNLTVIASELDTLYNAAGQPQSIANLRNQILQASNDLAALDIDTLLNDPTDLAKVQQLTTAINGAAGKIAADQAKVTAVVNFCTSLVNMVGDFATGNVLGGIGLVSTAIGQVKTL